MNVRNLTPRAQQVFQYAAMAAGEGVVGIRELLRGFIPLARQDLRGGLRLACQTLEELGLLQESEPRLGGGSADRSAAPRPLAEIQIDAPTESVLLDAERIAGECRRSYLAPEHIVLALLVTDEFESLSGVDECSRQEAFQELHAKEQELGKGKS